MPETEPRSLKWIHLDDFSPGIADRDFNAAGVLGPWPPGQAVLRDTFRCQALPNGALGPLPRRESTAFHLTYPVDVFSGQLNIVGFLIQGRVDGSGSGGYDEANWIVATEYLRTGLAAQRRFFQLRRLRMWEAAPTIETITTATDSFTSAVFRPAYLQSGRVATAATTPGTPALAVAWWGDPGTDVWAYAPNPATPTALTPATISAKDAGPMVVYQGRSLVAVRTSFSNMAAANAALWETNEMMFFTNSNLTTLASATASLFTPEDPGEIMGICVSDANELFVLKYRHGAYVIRGDIVFPTVARVPGVAGAGKMPQIPLASPLGVVYKSHGSGVYVWPGGERAECISPQIEPDNFRYQLQANWAYGNFGGTMEFHEDLIFVPPRFVYNMRNQSWWQLEDPADTAAPFGYLHFQKSVNPNSVIAMRGEIRSNAEDYAFSYTFDFGQTSYQWTSHPFHLSVDSSIQVREIVLRATGPGGSTVTINVIGEGATESHAFAIGANDYPRIKLDQSALLGGDVQIQIIADGSGNTAPIVYGVDVAYQEFNALPNSAS